MVNEFVDYLNTLNNASSSNENALAESQVTSKYYEKINVERAIVKLLVNGITSSDPRCYIITGHAGDGKTALLVQILRSLRLVEKQQPLKTSEYLQISPDRALLYVKDMSELKESDQKQSLLDALNAPHTGNSAILVSNTGPLINTFNGLFKNNAEEVEMALLDKMDKNDGEPLKVNDYEAYIVNMARIDNVGIVRELVSKVTAQELWSPVCTACDASSRCPIYSNIQLLTESHYKRNLIDFVESYYDWLHENDNRLTVRQILSHISFSITGNLTCQDVKRLSYSRKTFFDYGTFNLFFGYKGLERIKQSNQIRAIRELDLIGLDRVSLQQDYALFVQNDYRVYSEEDSRILHEVWTQFFNQNSDSELFNNSSNKAIELRRSFRRFFFFRAVLAEKQKSQLYGRLYGGIYPQFLTWKSESISNLEKEDIKNLVFDALFFIFSGISSRGEKKLYLTLKRRGDKHQDVQLIVGEIDKNDIVITHTPDNRNDFSDRDVFRIFITFSKWDGQFELTLPLLNYFHQIVEGSISTYLNPALGHGIDRLRAYLTQAYRFSNQHSIHLLVATAEGTEVISLEFDGTRMYVR